MDAESRKKIFRLKDLCMDQALVGKGNNALDAGTQNEAKVLLNFSVGPKMTYNELAGRLDSIIRGL